MSVFVLKCFNGYSFECMHNARGMHLICCIIKTISNLNLLHNSSSTNVSICLCCQLESFVFSIECVSQFSYYHLLLSFFIVFGCIPSFLFPSFLNSSPCPAIAVNMYSFAATKCQRNRWETLYMQYSIKDGLTCP